MFTGVFALLERSLRIDARDRWMHGLRLATVVVGYGSLISAAANGGLFGAPGLVFFQSLVTLNVLLIAAAGLSYFATVITEEKEEGTLGLMQMTGLSGLGILVGKSGSRLAQATFLILLQVPFALLGITLGGVTLSQVQAVTLALISLLFLVANLALLVSVVSRNSRQAAFRMTVVIIAYCAAAWLVYEAARVVSFGFPSRLGSGVIIGPTPPPIPNAAMIMNELNTAFLFTRIGRGLQSGVAPPLVSSHEIANVLVGLLAMALSWAIFGWATRQPDSEPISRGWPSWRFGRRTKHASVRVWGNRAIFWKEFHFLVGGWPRLCFKLAGYTLFVAMVNLYWYGWNTGWQRWKSSINDPAIEVASMILSLLLAWEGALLASRMFQEELRGQTWSTLVNTPIPFGNLCYTKVAVAFMGLAPAGFWLVVFTLFTTTGHRFLEDALDEPMFWAIVAAIVAVAHFATLLSLYIRWGAVPLAFACAWLPFMACAMILMPRGPEDELGVLMILIYGVLCAACHALVGRRLRDLAAE